jgi:hypothetical protein
MSEHPRSEQACPVCSQHTLALDQPPQIDVMGVQSYSDIVGMGDLKPQGSVGIICLNCDTRWRDKAAFEAGEVLPDGDLAGEEDALAGEDFGPDAFEDDGDE